MQTRRELMTQRRFARLEQEQKRRRRHLRQTISLVSAGTALSASGMIDTQQTARADTNTVQATRNFQTTTGSVGSQNMTSSNPENSATSQTEDYVAPSKGQGDMAFLNALGNQARTLAADNDLYASVMIAQALLESSWGMSDLAGAPNYNLFGIKGSYQGNQVSYSTLEDDGTGKMYSVQANFKKYPSYKASLSDYVSLLRHGTDDNPTIYAGAFRSNTKSYLDATKWLTGRYATDTQYADKLDHLIETYNLTQFDGPALVDYTVQSGDSLWSIAQNTGMDFNQLVAVNNLSSTSALMAGQVLKVKQTQPSNATQAAAPQPQAENVTVTQPATTAKPQLKPKRVTVTANDSLAKIAKANHISVAKLKSLNHLKTDLILVGQKLIIR
ncbi:glucosaminidase domain-containing protein [Agrilactobacillus fermenti]|uniref:glucosaminidase domain-containing protein n=1 Tax=Agrilactobacillus fermenti TaxID=2586909 RepID=UPI001E32CFE0|nr:glucosaminidase domain-containing protein [Agrilactobacillus fermenti]MCD2257148.1 LysM peptidoglycan-binding domain-containing protein [Agrilactobacillus fermenti]